MGNISIDYIDYFPQIHYHVGSNVTDIKKDDDLWCCKSTKDDCTVELNSYGTVVNCIGHPIPLTQQCHDGDISTPRCNYYPDDEDRNYKAKRAFLDVCQDNR